MDRKKVFSIITIVCFASIIFIPIGLVLMCYFTDWKRKKKVIIGAIMTVLYILPVVIILNLQPANNTSGVNLPGNFDAGSTQFESNGKSRVDPDGEYELVDGIGKSEIENPEDLEGMTLPSTIKKEGRNKASRWLFPVIFFVIMLILIIIQNIKSAKHPDGYDNPYVDVKKYKIPIEDESSFPTVHYLKINHNPGELIFYATETIEKDNEGDFVVSNQRVVISNKRGTVSYEIKELTVASSVSNNVMMLASGNEKNYIFLPENQMKYALGIVRYAYKKYGN